MKLRIGFNLWGNLAPWDALMAAGRTVEALGFDALWASDHFIPPLAPVDGVDQLVPGPNAEGWMVAAGWAAQTSRVTVGTLVSSASYRNPAIMVKMASGLDHLSGGRAILGIGAGWFVTEHERFGVDLLAPEDRFDRLADAAAICRGMLDGGATTPTTHEGRWWSVRDAVNDPPPVQARLPLLIAGGGERRTIPIVARYADIWNVQGDVAALARKNRLLDSAAVAIGRPPRAIRRTAHLAPALIRATRDEAVPAMAELYQGVGIPWNRALEMAFASPNVGTEEDVVASLAAVVRAGFDEVSFEQPLPADEATLVALAGPVRDRLAKLLA